MKNTNNPFGFSRSPPKIIEAVLIPGPWKVGVLGFLPGKPPGGGSWHLSPALACGQHWAVVLLGKRGREALPACG